MKNLILIILFLINSFVFGQDLDSRQSRIIKGYISEIDASLTNDFSDLIETIFYDTTVNKFHFSGNEYCTFEYIIIKLILSKNILNCKRQKFLEQVVELKIKQIKQPTTIGLLYYFKNEWSFLDDINFIKEANELDKSFLSSLLLTKMIINKKYSNCYSEFIKEVNLIYKEYMSIDNGEESLKLLLPLNELFKIWQNKFPKKFYKKATKYILSKVWSPFESILLQDFIYLIEYKSPECNSKLNIDPRVLVCSYVGGTRDFEFMVENSLIPKNR
jgi:hypothetical protein